MGNIYPIDGERWTYYNVDRIESRGFEFTGVGAYAECIITPEDTPILSGELVFSGVLGVVQGRYTEGLRCTLKIVYKTNSAQTFFEEETHSVYIKFGVRSGSNLTVPTHGGDFERIEMRLETMPDTRFTSGNTLILYWFMINNMLPAGGITDVTTDSSLTGNGTQSNPLSVSVANILSEDELNLAKVDENGNLIVKNNVVFVEEPLTQDVVDEIPYNTGLFTYSNNRHSEFNELCLITGFFYKLPYEPPPPTEFIFRFEQRFEEADLSNFVFWETAEGVPFIVVAESYVYEFLYMGAVWLSYDGGITFQQRITFPTPPGMLPGWRGWAPLVVGYDENNIKVIVCVKNRTSNNPYIIYSYNAFDWVTVNTPFIPQTIGSRPLIFIRNGNRNIFLTPVGSRFGSSSNPNFYRSFNGAKTWQAGTFPRGGNVEYNFIPFLDDDGIETLLAFPIGSSAGTLYISKDGGDSWQYTWGSHPFSPFQSPFRSLYVLRDDLNRLVYITSANAINSTMQRGVCYSFDRADWQMCEIRLEENGEDISNLIYSISDIELGEDFDGSFIAMSLFSVVQNTSVVLETRNIVFKSKNLREWIAAKWESGNTEQFSDYYFPDSNISFGKWNNKPLFIGFNGLTTRTPIFRTIIE